MKKLVAFVILLIGGGTAWWYYVKYGTPPEPAVVNKQVISMGTIVEAVKSTGALEPLRRYDVGSQVSGVVQAIHVDYNDIVKKDQLMAEIDPSLLQVQVQIQQANVERQKSDIASQEVQLEDQKKQKPQRPLNTRFHVTLLAGFLNRKPIEFIQCLSSADNRI